MIQRFAAVLGLMLTLVAGVPAHAADKVSDGQWFHQVLKTDQAHAITEGEGVIVAVVDTGVDSSHPDLSGSVLQGKDFTGPGDGRTDAEGHGTIMAGLIASHGRVDGIAPHAKILPVRVSTAHDGAVDLLATGVRWAVANGADVVSISSATLTDDLLLRQEIQAAIAAGAVVIASAGNRPDDDRVMFPAAFPGVVAVTGLDRNGNHSDTSVSGPEAVIAAPSEHISSTGPNGGYSVTSGTSDATAIVAGAVALIRSKFPDLSATEVVRRLTATATDKGAPGRDSEYGYGVLNLVAALTADLPATTTPAIGATTATAGPTDPPSREDGFPWWLIAVLPLVAVGIAVLVWMRQRRA